LPPSTISSSPCSVSPSRELSFPHPCMVVSHSGTRDLHLRFLRAEIVSNSPVDYHRVESQGCFGYECLARKYARTWRQAHLTISCPCFGGLREAWRRFQKLRGTVTTLPRRAGLQIPEPRAGPVPRRAHLCRRFVGLSLGQETESFSSSTSRLRSLGSGLLGVPHH
jgi:hypothetical protein